MYECDCREGFTLHSNGYSCFRKSPSVNSLRYPVDVSLPPFQLSAYAKRSLFAGTNSSNSDGDSSSSSSSTFVDSEEGVSKTDSSSYDIHIEVDIDPPPHRPNDPSDEELERLGLPTHHVHYHSRPDGTLVSDEDDDDKDEVKVKAGEPAGPAQFRPANRQPVERGDLAPLNADDDAVEPPRALPVFAHARAAAEELAPAQSKTSGGEDEYPDRVYEIDAFCNLECGVEGECFMARDSKNTIKKRCLCPHGKYGEKCSLGTFNLPQTHLPDSQRMFSFRPLHFCPEVFRSLPPRPADADERLFRPAVERRVPSKLARWRAPTHRRIRRHDR